MKKLLFIVGLLATITSSSQPPVDKRLAGLDTLAARVLREWKAPGISIAVVEKGKIVYTGGFGYRDIDKKLPVTSNTLFAIGSCTKAFTAAILGMLQKDGLVDLDQPVRNYLPELKFQNEYANAHVTLRDMMSHRTGLPRHDMSWYASPASRSELLERIQHLEPTEELRARFQYNNFMFLAQGMVIEKITGKSWEENIREKIFKPLGMNSTVVSISEMEKSADHSLAYATIKDSIIKYIPYRNIDAIGPAGSINSSANDMAKWLITWINSGKYNDKEIIPASYRSQAMTVQMATGGGLPGAEFPDLHSSGYGLGWGINSYRGHYRVEHGGGIDGFITSTAFFPSDSIGIFVVSNQGGPVAVIRNFISDRMLKLSPRNWQRSQLEAAKKARESAKSVVKNDSLNRKFQTKHSHELAAYAGTYSNPGYGELEVGVKDNSLSSKYNGIPMRLDHYHYDQFAAYPQDPAFEGDDPLRISFHTDVKGDVYKLTIPLQVGTKDIEFVKQAKAIALKKAELDRYTGDYELAPGTIAKFYIKKDSILYAFLEGQPEYELMPLGKHLFELKIMKGYSVKFEENENKKIISASFIQPNGTFKAIKKN